MRYFVGVDDERQTHLAATVHAYYGECGTPIVRLLSQHSHPLDHIAVHLRVCDQCWNTTKVARS